MDNNVGVRITATSAVGPGVQETKTQLGGLESFVQTLSSSFATMGTRMREAFTGGAGAATEMTGAIRTTEAATVSETAALTAMIAKVHEGAESVRTFQMRAKEFAEVYVALFAVDQIASFIAKMGEAAEKVEHLSQQFGMTVAEVQKFQGVAKASGISVDALTRGMGLLDRNMATAAAGSKRMQQALDAVGVSLNDGRSQMQKFEAVADKFQHMEDGPKKAALAMQLFGRSGRELIPVLNLGSAGIEALNQKMIAYGVVNEDAVAKGAVLAASVNDTKLGMDGLWNTLTESLAPALTEVVDGLNSMIQALIQSYNEGGAARGVMDTLSGTIEILYSLFDALGQIVAAVGGAFSDLSSVVSGDMSQTFGVDVPTSLGPTTQGLKEMRDEITILKDSVIIFTKLMGMSFDEFASAVGTDAKVMYDALDFWGGGWDRIDSDWQAGLDRIEAETQDTTNKVVALAQEMQDAINGKFTLKDIYAQSLPKQNIPTPKDFDFSPSPTGGKEKKGKSDKASELDIWKQQLSDMLLLEENWGVDEKAFSERFWEDKLALVKKGSKEEIEIRRMINGEKKALFKEELQAETESIKTAETIRLDDAKTQTALAKEALNQKIADINEQEKLGKISAVRAVAERNQVNQQLLDLDRAEATAEFNIKLQALEAELALLHQTPAEQKKVNDQILILKRQFYNQMSVLDAQYNAKVKAQNAALVDAYVAKWKGIVQPITSALSGMFNALYTRQMTFRQAAIQAMDSIVMSWAQKGIEALGNWIATQLGMRAAQHATEAETTASQTATDATKLVSAETTNFSQIISEAPVAAAGAFAATAAIPYVGPALAPGAASAAYAAVMGMAPMAFAEQGFDVPWGKNPLTQLHQEEMVLPATLANPLRDLLASGFMLRSGDRGATAGRSAGETGRTSITNNGGDANLHYNPQVTSHEASLGDLLHREARTMRKWLQNEVRNGTIKMPGHR